MENRDLPEATTGESHVSKPRYIVRPERKCDASILDGVVQKECDSGDEQLIKTSERTGSKESDARLMFAAAWIGGVQSEYRSSECVLTSSATPAYLLDFVPATKEETKHRLRGTD